MAFWIAVYANTWAFFLKSAFHQSVISSLMKLPYFKNVMSDFKNSAPKLNWKNSHLGNSKQSILNFRPNWSILMCWVTYNILHSSTPKSCVVVRCFPSLIEFHGYHNTMVTVNDDNYCRNKKSSFTKCNFLTVAP